MRGVDGVIGVDGAQGTQGVQGLTGPIAGSDTQVIFNDGGVSGATSDLVFDKTNKRLGIGTTALFSTLQVDDYGVAVGTGTFMASAGTEFELDDYNFLQSDNSIHKVFEYTIYIENSVGIQVQKILLMTDGTSAYHQDYAIMNTSSLIVQFESGLQGSGTTQEDIYLAAVPETGISGITTYKYVRKVLI